jgi:hypothetical protein
MKRLVKLSASVALLVPCFTPPAESPASVGAPHRLPANVVAVVSHVPRALGTMTRRELHRALAQVAAPRRAPGPGSARYERLKHFAMKHALEQIWIQGQAAEMEIRASAREISRELMKLRKQNFRSYAEYRRFLKLFHLSVRDVNERVKVQILSSKIDRRLLSDVEPGQQEQVIKEFVAAFNKRWRARTVCATGYIVADQCSNGEPAAITP